MSNNHLGRHRKPSPPSAIAARTAFSVGTAVTAVLLSAGAATAGTAPSASPDAKPGFLPCTGTPLDSVTKGVTGSYCGSNPGS